MANIKISDLTSASAAADANEFEINESGTSKKVTGSQIKAYVNAGDGALAAKNTVATADIDNDAVTTAKILDANVTTAKLAADAVDGTKIADDAIGNEHIATDAVNADSIAANSVGADELNVTGNGTAGQALTSDADGSFSWTDMGGGGGSLKAQVFTTPGTWTKPASTQAVKVTVMGGGGGGASPNTGGGLNATQNGGTSSFGAFASATGGQGGRRVPSAVTGTPGVGSVPVAANRINATSGYAFQQIPGTSPNSITDGQGMTYGDVTGWGVPNTASPAPGGNQYSTSKTTTANRCIAGRFGTGQAPGGSGGGAIATIPGPSIPGPVAVTVGNSGARGPGPSVCYSGTGGVVIVEWIEE